ncbi:biotin--[acetyl-CoA-carboxylase] ligase [Marinospirillum sp. MEB164]|uniref:Bifunctional ligase/repressor BirA n=1 Tax=Marinospirillum alkalitolerans TaxID=3123374 RepID=A0ABW8Q003_9GAMM
MNLYPLLHLLNSSRFVSGTELGRQLALSRAAIWKQIKQLEQLGLEIETHRQQGYRLSQAYRFFEPALLSAALKAQTAPVAHLEVYPSCASTNLLLHERLQQGQTIHQAMIVTDLQTAGRGRRGRAWISPLGSSICLSWGWRFEGSAQQLEGLSLAVGVVLVQVLQELGIEGVGLKWPNDLYTAEGKLGGILIELAGDLAGPCELILGVGLNDTRPQQQAEIDQPLAYLSDYTKTLPDKNQLAALLTQAVFTLLASYLEQGFAAYTEKWNELHLWRDRQVRVLAHGQQEQVRLGGVNQRGELEVFNHAGASRFLSGGEISVRVEKDDSGS